MNILYYGNLLQDGLRRLGHTLFTVPPDPHADIEAVIAAAPAPVDMVLIELWRTFLPARLERCPVPLAAWCVDSSLNEFWHMPCAPLFDHVFVDQQDSVTRYARQGIKAHWLPFFAQIGDFRPCDTRKEYDLVFVGRTPPERTKRNNILRLLQQYFTFPVVEGLSVREMSDLFARSKVVLNENFFSGLTARVFQGMAACSLVFTEAGGVGVADVFADGKHLVCYDSSTIVVSRAANALSPCPASTTSAIW